MTDPRRPADERRPLLANMSAPPRLNLRVEPFRAGRPDPAPGGAGRWRQLVVDLAAALERTAPGAEADLDPEAAPVGLWLDAAPDDPAPDAAGRERRLLERCLAALPSSGATGGGPAALRLRLAEALAAVPPPDAAPAFAFARPADPDQPSAPLDLAGALAILARTNDAMFVAARSPHVAELRRNRRLALVWPAMEAP